MKEVSCSHNREKTFQVLPDLMPRTEVRANDLPDHLVELQPRPLPLEKSCQLSPFLLLGRTCKLNLRDRESSYCLAKSPKLRRAVVGSWACRPFRPVFSAQEQAFLPMNALGSSCTYVCP